MYISRTVLPVLIALLIFSLGCTVQSRYKTRSFLTEEELEKVNESYLGPKETDEEEEAEIEPFLEGLTGPVVRVNTLEILAEDIRELYEYLASTTNEDPLTLKQRACMEWIQTYAVMSQWPDKIHVAIERLEDIRLRVAQGADFEGLIVENSQEADAEFRKGDLGVFERRDKEAILEMHAFQDPLNQLSQPFPTVIGWHLLQVLERDTDIPNKPTVHARELLLYHGLDPNNKQDIQSNYIRWTNLADIELLSDELNDILPQYAKRRPEESSEE
jgi:hypothetical protein